MFTRSNKFLILCGYSVNMLEKTNWSFSFNVNNICCAGIVKLAYSLRRLECNLLNLQNSCYGKF